jgi:prophage maintenance system killer protein
MQTDVAHPTGACCRLAEATITHVPAQNMFSKSLSIARSILYAHTCHAFVDGERNISIRAAIAFLQLWFTDTQVRWPYRVAKSIMGVIAIKL